MQLPVAMYCNTTHANTFPWHGTIQSLQYVYDYTSILTYVDTLIKYLHLIPCIMVEGSLVLKLLLNYFWIIIYHSLEFYKRLFRTDNLGMLPLSGVNGASS